MTHYIPDQLPIPQLANLLTAAIGPRPIALASTIDADGNPNLSPFSFFNAFGTNPPILIFSPARRGRDNTTKHTFENLKQVPEVVINVVTYDMVHQVSLASSDYPRGTNEFQKAGFTMIPSLRVKPPRVGESPVQFECKVQQVIETGDQAAAGNLVICRVVAIHVDNKIQRPDGSIEPLKTDLVGRLGDDFYCRASGDALFRIPKPAAKPGIGVDNLPPHVLESEILKGNHIGQLGNSSSMPTALQLEEAKKLAEVVAIEQEHHEPPAKREAYHRLVRKKIESGEVSTALNILFLSP
ncbi:MAG: flavin reductase family protein [Bacteroidales bacterium]|nr:flavin reductase family protein [Bacteroidales bacterium]MDD3665413.1 flavin reductase family protein [Bacteroidales bacterium]